MAYFVILFLIGFNIYVLCFLKIKCVIEYLRNDVDDNFAVSFYTLNGEFKYKYEVPFMNLGRSGLKFKLVREQGIKDKSDDEKLGRLKPTEIYEKYMEFSNFYKYNHEMVCDIRNYVKNRLVLYEFNLKVSEGLDNAAHTAIVCGFLWSVAGLLSTFLINYFKTFKKCISITPNYSKKEFSVDLFCIFHLKLVNIIVIVLKIRRGIKNRKKLNEETGDGTNDGTSNRRPNDDGNGKYQGNG